LEVIVSGQYPCIEIEAFREKMRKLPRKGIIMPARIPGKLMPSPLATTVKGSSMTQRNRTEWYDEPPIIIGAFLAILALIGYLGRYLFLYGRDILAGGLEPCIEAFWKGAAAFAGVLVGGIGGTAASITLLSCVVIPVTTVSIYTIFRKAEDKPKALIVAISLFLDPLFIDFFKDEIGKDDALRKILIDAFGVITFLSGAYFWNRATGERSRETGKVWRVLARIAAVLLFLLPTLGMLGYIAAEANGDWADFVASFSPEKIIGLVGLLAVAVVGIGLSRYYEGP
jgi:hypothetical protein